MPEIVAAVVAIAALVLFRLYAVREVAARRGRFVWVFAFPMILLPAVMVWVGLRLLSSGQLLGTLPILFGAATGTLELQFFRRSSRAVSTASADQDLDEVLVEPATDFVLVMTVGNLIFAVVLGIGLIVWAVLTQGH